MRRAGGKLITGLPESAEMSLHVLAYCLKRVMRNLGVEEPMRVLTCNHINSSTLPAFCGFSPVDISSTSTPGL